MNELQNFTFDGSTVRTIMINSEPHFIGKDVAEILGYSNPLKAIRTHVDQEDRGVNEMDTPGGKQRLIVINESGLYSLILSSKLPTAKRFKHWVTSEVLPTIRKHGAYAVDDLLDDPDLAIKAFTALKEERAKRKAVEAKNAEMKPKALFADAVATSNTCILIGDLAKILKQNGIEIGQRRLFAWMRENGYLIKRKGADWNSPTQRAMQLGLFEIKETAIDHSDGHVTVSKTTKVTGKGQIYFVDKFIGKEL